ncbi:MAG: NUDIX domain-containing protein [Fervidobacterium sp.]
MCYAKYEDKILFIKRNKEPFKGFLVPPGGRVEEGEGVVDAVFREFKEETSLDSYDLKLKMVTSEKGPENNNWILFIFTGKVNSDKVIESDKGELFWINENNVLEEKISPIDKRLIPHILSEEPDVKVVFIDYHENRTLKHVEILSLESIGINWDK